MEVEELRTLYFAAISARYVERETDCTSGRPCIYRLILHIFRPQRESTVVFDDPKGKSAVNGVHTLESSETNSSTTLAVFECRGCELQDFEPRVSVTGMREF